MHPQGVQVKTLILNIKCLPKSHHVILKPFRKPYSGGQAPRYHRRSKLLSRLSGIDFVRLKLLYRPRDVDFTSTDASGPAENNTTTNNKVNVLRVSLSSMARSSVGEAMVAVQRRQWACQTAKPSPAQRPLYDDRSDGAFRLCGPWIGGGSGAIKLRLDWPFGTIGPQRDW